MNVGRNFAKILRVIDAFHATDAQDVATLYWLPGGAVIIPMADRTDEAHRHFSQWLDRDAPVPAPHDAVIARGRAVVV